MERPRKRLASIITAMLGTAALTFSSCSPDNGGKHPDFNKDGIEDYCIKHKDPIRNDHYLFVKMSKEGHGREKIKLMKTESELVDVDLYDYNNDGWTDIMVVEFDQDSTQARYTLFSNNLMGGFNKRTIF